LVRRHHPKSFRRDLPLSLHIDDEDRSIADNEIQVLVLQSTTPHIRPSNKKTKKGANEIIQQKIMDDSSPTA
jgi:uncharacterized protein YeeX (DUF496 family)